MVLKVGMILVDLQKTFDTLDHKILLDKMKCIGFSGKAIKWFYSYLTNRVIFVSLDTVFLEAGAINQACRDKNQVTKCPFGSSKFPFRS